MADSSQATAVTDTFKVKKFRTKADGNCFFHSAFGEEEQGEYIAHQAKTMRLHWHQYLQQFDSLTDPKMPKALAEELEKILGTFLDAPELLGEDFLVSAFYQKIKKDLAEMFTKVDNVEQGLIAKILATSTENDKLFIAFVRKILEDSNSKHKDIIFSIKNLFEDNDKPSDQEILSKKIIIKNRLRNNRGYVKWQIKNHRRMFIEKLDKKYKDDKNYEDSYSTKKIINDFTHSKELYDFYLNAIKSQEYYIITEEITIISALFNKKIHLYYTNEETQADDYKLVEPDPGLIAWITDCHLINQSSNLSEEVIIHHRGIHYERAKLIKISQNKNLKKIDNSHNKANLPPEDTDDDDEEMNLNPPLRNLDFTPRRELMDSILKELEQNHFAVLSGTGGYGKTQLALAYYYQMPSCAIKNKYTVTVWIKENMDVQAVIDLIAARLNLETPTDSARKINKALKFRNRCLLVFDDIDDTSIIDEVREKISIDEIDIICTTRTNDRDVWGGSVIEVGAYTMTDGMAYIKKALRHNVENITQGNSKQSDEDYYEEILNTDASFDDYVRKLFRKTKGSPQVLSDAINFLKERGLTISEFLENESFLSESYSKNKLSDFINEESFNKENLLNQGYPKLLMNFCAFLDHKGATRDFLLELMRIEDSSVSDDDSDSTVDDDITMNVMPHFNQSIVTLTRHSIITTRPGYKVGNLFSMNKRLQQAIIESMDKETRLAVIEKITAMLSGKIVDKDKKAITSNQRLIEDDYLWAEHAEEIIEHLNQYEELYNFSGCYSLKMHMYLLDIFDGLKYHCLRQKSCEGAYNYARESYKFIKMLKKSPQMDNSIMRLIYETKKYDCLFLTNKLNRERLVTGEITEDQYFNSTEEVYGKLEKLFTAIENYQNTIDPSNEEEFHSFDKLKVEVKYKYASLYSEVDKHKQRLPDTSPSPVVTPSAPPVVTPPAPPVVTPSAPPVVTQSTPTAVTQSAPTVVTQPVLTVVTQPVIPLAPSVSDNFQASFLLINAALNGKLDAKFNINDVSKSNDLDNYFIYNKMLANIVNVSQQSIKAKTIDIKSIISDIDDCIMKMEKNIESKKAKAKSPYYLNKDRNKVNKFKRLRIKLNLMLSTLHMPDNVELKSFKKGSTNFIENYRDAFKYAHAYYKSCIRYPELVKISDGKIFYELSKVMNIYLHRYANLDKNYRNDEVFQRRYKFAVMLSQWALYFYRQLYLHHSHKNYNDAKEVYGNILGLLDFDASLMQERFIPNSKARNEFIKEEIKLSDTLKANHTDVAARVSYAKTLMALGKVEQAIDEYTLLAKNKLNIDAYLHRAHLYHFLKKYPEAIRDYQHVLAYRPDDVNTDRWLKTLLSEQSAEYINKRKPLSDKKESFVSLLKEHFVKQVVFYKNVATGVDKRSNRETAFKVFSALAYLVPSVAMDIQPEIMGVKAATIKTDIKPREAIQQVIEVLNERENRIRQYVASKIAANETLLQDAIDGLAAKIANDYEPQIKKLDEASVKLLAKVAAIKMINHIGSDRVNTLLPIHEQLLQGLSKGKVTVFKYKNKRLNFDEEYQAESSRIWFWTAEGIFGKSGIFTEEGFFYSQNRSTFFRSGDEIYGFHFGSATEAQNLRLREKNIEDVSITKKF